MGKEKITGNMSTTDMIMTMCEGDPGALNVIVQMMNDPRSFMDVLLCDSLDIRGAKLYALNHNCCNRNTDKFNRTLMMLRCGVFSEEQIHQNLNLPCPISFIDDDIIIDGVPPYGKSFGSSDEKWEEFCAKNKESFIQKLNAALENQAEYRGDSQKI